MSDERRESARVVEGYIPVTGQKVLFVEMPWSITSQLSPVSPGHMNRIAVVK